MGAMSAAELQRAGWTKQATYDEPRLSEMVDAYRELGFEVRVEPFEPDADAECSACMKLAPHRFKTIYTRKSAES